MLPVRVAVETSSWRETPNRSRDPTPSPLAPSKRLLDHHPEHGMLMTAPNSAVRSPQILQSVEKNTCRKCLAAQTAAEVLWNAARSGRTRFAHSHLLSNPTPPAN